MNRREWRESDLAPPITAYLVAQGYTVRSEVKDCDITAVQGDELIIVELKRGVTVDLLIQAVERQRSANSVYVAIPSSGEKRERYTKRWQGMERLLKRLELGLMLVHLAVDTPATVEIMFHPMTSTKPRQRPKQRRAILREIAGRSDDYNVGGSTRSPLLTAYREQAIQIALYLQTDGPQTPAVLRKKGCSVKTQSILHQNVYGWFEKVERGVYTLRPTVIEHIDSVWPVFTNRCREKMIITINQPD